MYDNRTLRPSQEELARWAYFYQEFGCSVIGLVGKYPLRGSQVVRWREKPRTLKQLKRHFANPKIDGIGIIPGEFSGGFAVRDYDDEEGRVNYQAWRKNYPEEASVYPQEMTGRGFHVLGRLKEERYVAKAKMGDGELSGNRLHYVAVVPTWHPKHNVRYVFTRELFGYRHVSELPLLSEALTRVCPFSEWPKAVKSPNAVKNSPKIDSLSSVSSLPSTSLVSLAPTPTPHIELMWGDSTQVNYCWEGVDDFITETLPTRVGERYRKIGCFVRFVKGMYANLTYQQQHDIIKAWHRQALPIIGTKPFEETLRDFRKLYAECKWPICKGALWAYRLAVANPDPPIDNWTWLGILSAMCRILGKETGRFYLASRSIAAMFKFSDHKKALHMLDCLAKHKIIVRTKQGTYADKQASEWQYLGGKHEGSRVKVSADYESNTESGAQYQPA